MSDKVSCSLFLVWLMTVKVTLAVPRLSGSFRDFLKHERTRIRSEANKVTIEDLMKYLSMIFSGCNYLHNKDILHGALRAE